MEPLPEGYEMALHVYLVSDSLDATACIAMRCSVGFAPAEQGDPQALAKSVNAPEAADWRFMTRAEIAELKAEQLAEGDAT